MGGEEYRPSAQVESPGRKSFEEWSEDMILDLGDEVAPHLSKIWQEIHSEKSNR